MTAVRPTPEVFAGPLGAQLRRRVQQASADARCLLGLPIDSARPPDLARSADLAGPSDLTGPSDSPATRTSMG
jgi:hypothetical protein